MKNKLIVISIVVLIILLVILLIYNFSNSKESNINKIENNENDLDKNSETDENYFNGKKVYEIDSNSYSKKPKVPDRNLSVPSHS